MIQDGTDVAQAFVSLSPSNPSNGSKSASKKLESWKGPPIPSTINVCAPRDLD
eukprot:CAMPEP_0116577288 /NCGR_PEP_ID=MMETSP0397-20121206/21066_1 /TAXON_ID=216820 /ORGANISM="Cyclophora tenuis, Strain ECT3854" /LENGTH=52 /DNA_ID=CAMNT_0004106547 /DNA_START=54 /DNA_END=209 /DNA_ORIENTATION=-